MNRLIHTPTAKFRRFRRHHQHPTSTTDPNPLQILWRYQILDPDSEIVTYWNHVFLLTSIIALFIDPLYFYLPYVGPRNRDRITFHSDYIYVCLSIDKQLAVLITYFRSIADMFFSLHILMKFRTAFVAPSSRVFGRGELVIDAKEIAMRYLKSDFLIDMAAALPLPQIVIWLVLLPRLPGLELDTI
ncbi:CYCLIC NUCLEOTIDE-GATED ION CHANNEL 18 [Salix koriyanagi]|uniref:CYCLIC NUCLEOTIDE-GATED ION CHANNEL 18 n=1 Tax=Salix koriyanagi TaxID=2511006 RepID=A0A9Q0W039_9ROSI|nr:CYCLIC NUCLEOTIDE-GATED ION CHANNEL 18 [Salix koriyanagi]